MEAEELLRVAQEGGFWSYGAGVAYKIMTDYRVGGLCVDNYRTTLPLKKGLSSSAALCVMIARAFNRAYDLKMTVRGEMEYAYQGEIVTPSRCGRMDQVRAPGLPAFPRQPVREFADMPRPASPQACAFGARPVKMTYDGDFVDARPVHVPRPLHLVVADLRAAKDTVVILVRRPNAAPPPPPPPSAGLTPSSHCWPSHRCRRRSPSPRTRCSAGWCACWARPTGTSRAGRRTPWRAGTPRSLAA